MLTLKQHQVFKFIQTYHREYGYAPTYREIAQHLQVQTTGSIRKYIKALTNKGYIENCPHHARGIRITQSYTNDQNINSDDDLPLVGKIAAGKPMMAFECIEHINLNTHLKTHPQCYILEVQGNSMKDAGILEGDWVIIKPQSFANNGDIAVALIHGYETTLKRFLNTQDGSITLIPENKTMEAMTFPSDQVQIQGIVMAQLRRY